MSSPPPAVRSLLRDPTFVAALAIAVVVAIGFGLVVPILPLYARAFGVGLFAVTAVVSVFAFVRLISHLYTGSLSDRIGARRAIGIGALVVAVSSLLTATAPNYWALIVFRGAGGFGSALFFNAILSLVVSSVPSALRGRAVGLLQGAFLFGISIGPSVGGLLAAPLGLRWPFVIYGLFCLAAAAVAMVFLPKVGRPGRGHVEAAEGAEGEPVAAVPAAAVTGIGPLIRAAGGLCRDRAFVAALIMMAASRWAATGVRFSLVPVFGDEVVGASAQIIGFALTLAALTHLAMLWPAGKAADTLGRRAVGIPAFFVFAVIAAFLGFADTVPLFLLAMAAYGIGTGLSSVTPPAVVGDIAPPEQTGVAVGALNTAGDLGAVLGPLVSGWLAERAGYPWGFGASAVLLAVAGLYAIRMRETLDIAESGRAAA